MLRFAPSPTGDMHIGNLRAALINYAMAKKLGESFFVRIEDTDHARNQVDKSDAILQVLALFGLQSDFVVLQSDNLERHREIARLLVDGGEAFYCGCTKEFLESKKQEAIDSKKPFRYDDSWALEFDSGLVKEGECAIRLKGAETSISFRDEIKGDVAFDKGELDSFVIMRSDGTPTYNFACAVDDYDYGVDFIIRGEDHVSNTPRQILIKQALQRLGIRPLDSKNGPQSSSVSQVRYAHLPIILGRDGKKLSKRDESSSVAHLLESGYLPSAISNYLLLLGNKPLREIFTLQEACEFIDISSISKSPALFDIDLLGHVNREHMKRLGDPSLKEIFQEEGEQELALARLICEESFTLKEAKDSFCRIFAPKDLDEFPSYAKSVRVLYELSRDLESMNYEDFKKYLMDQSGLKGKEFFKSLRILLSGRDEGIELEVLYNLISHRLADVIRSCSV